MLQNPMANRGTKPPENALKTGIAGVARRFWEGIWGMWKSEKRIGVWLEP